MPRFVLLEHVGHLDDAGGRHFDLLVEDGPACRTWKLLDVPQPGGEAIPARELPRHRLEWLDTREAEVSGNRGVARRIAHALGFEAGLVVMLVPLFAWWLGVSLWQAFVLGVDGWSGGRPLRKTGPA